MNVTISVPPGQVNLLHPDLISVQVARGHEKNLDHYANPKHAPCNRAEFELMQARIQAANEHLGL